MTSEAHEDIGPMLPSCGKLRTHAKDVMDFARNAMRCADDRDPNGAMEWLDRARRAATLAEGQAK